MLWMAMLAAGGLQAAKGHLQSAQGAVNANQQQLNNLASQLSQTRQQTYQLQDLATKDDAIVEANTQNTILANYKAGILQIQQGQQLQQNTKASEGIREAGLKALSAANVTSAAAGSVGSSVTAVAQDIQAQADDALIQNQENADAVKMNFQTAMHDLYAGLNNVLQVPVVGRMSDFDSLQDVDILHGESWGASFKQAAFSQAASYATSYMSLGLGQGQQQSGMTSSFVPGSNLIGSGGVPVNF